MSDYNISSLLLAHGLAREQGKNFGDDIASAIRLAKKKVLTHHCSSAQIYSSLLKKWNAAEEKRLKQESELQSFLLMLLEEHRKQ